MELIIIFICIVICYIWYRKVLNKRFRNEIKNGKLIHFSGSTPEELIKEIVEHDPMINRVTAYEIAVNSLGIEKKYVINKDIDTFFMEQLRYGDIREKCSFGDITRTQLEKIILKYFYDKGKSFASLQCTWYFSYATSLYSAIKSMNRYKIFDDITGIGKKEVGVLVDNYTDIDIDNKIIGIWLYYYGGDEKIKLYYFCRFDFKNKINKIQKYLFIKDDNVELYSENDKGLPDCIEKKAYKSIEDIYNYYCQKLNLITQKENNKYVTKEYINKLNWREFEIFISNLFKNNGYDAYFTSATNDEGRDVIATKEGKKYYIECKKFSDDNSVGREIIQKLVGATATDKVYKCICITTGKYTKTATEYAKNVNKQRGYSYIELWDIDKIVQFGQEISLDTANTISKRKDYIYSLEKEYMEPIVHKLILNSPQLFPQSDKKSNFLEKTRNGYICPKCGKGKLVLRSGPYGRFWGCNKYPNCKITIKDYKGRPKMK